MNFNWDKKMGVASLILFVVVYLTVVALLHNKVFLFQGILSWGVWLAISLLLLGPFVWLGYRSKRDINIKKLMLLLFLAACIMLVELLLLLAPSLGWLASLNWNWQGKLASFIFGLMIVTLWSRLSWKEIGLSKPKSGSWLRVGSILAGTTAFFVISGSGSESMGIDLETILFQGTMPGLEEELIYRGILWVLIAQALPGTRKLWKADIGWNLIITTVLFSLVHGVTFDNSLTFVFDPAVIIFTGVAGFVIGWIRAYSGSILPAVVLHNGINLLAVAIPWLLGK